jgi:hypothetical protein
LGSQFKGFASQLVDGSEISTGDFENGVDGLFVKGEGMSAGYASSVLHVVVGFGTGEQSQGGDVSHASSDGLERWNLEHMTELVITSEDETEHQAGVHVEVGEYSESGKHGWAHVLGIVK